MQLIDEQDDMSAAFDDFVEAETPEQRAAREMRDRITGLGRDLLAEVERRIAERRPIEARWTSDLKRYNAQYEDEEWRKLESRKYGSKIFVPVTRRVCNIVEARWSDMMFPTDDRNFVIETSPVPDLVDGTDLSKQLPPEHPVNLGGQQMPAGAVQQAIDSILNEANKRAAAMQRTVDDQLTQCNYHAAARTAIHDAVVLGTGVLKGPVVSAKRRKVWSLEGGVASLQMVERLDPVVEAVDPWDFFPEMTATRIEESSTNFQRYRLSKRDLLKLAEQPGFDEDAIREVVASGFKGVGDSDAARREASDTTGVKDERFTIYGFYGAVDSEDLVALGIVEPDSADDFYDGVIFFSDSGTILKAMINVLDTQEHPFSVLNWQADSVSVFGYGLPFELADIQNSINSSYRAAHDNMGLSVGPQIVVNSGVVTPQNGNWVIEPNKVWVANDRAVNVGSAFAFFQIDSRLNDLMGIFGASKQLADELGGPQMAMQGQDSPALMQSATAATIAYSTASIWMRRAVKLFDDQVTAPMIGRFVDWNMQFNPDPDIKGDFNVTARGTSSLLAAEGQVQKIQQFAQMSAAAGIPLRNVVAQLRAAARAMRLDDEDLLPDDDAIKQMEAQRAQQGPPPNPEMERIKMRQAELQNNEAERRHQLQLAQMSNQMRMAELAQKESLTMEQLRAKYGLDVQKAAAELADRKEARAQDAQKFNAEIAIKQRQGSGI